MPSSATSSSYLFTVGVILLTAVLIILWIVRRLLSSGGGRSKGAGSRNTVLLAGLQNTGKTAFFFKLRDGKVYRTLASMKENEGTFVPAVESIIATSGSGSGGGDSGGNAAAESESEEDKDSGNLLLPSTPLHVVDIPGHERLRSTIRHYLPVAATILFFVDSVDIASTLSDNAEYMYDILTNKHVVNRQVPVCVVCNKSDIALFRPEYIKRQLEMELEKIRRTRANQMDLQMNDNEGRDVVDLVSDDSKPFSFDDNCQTEVSFVSCSVTKSQNMKEVIQFIAQST